MSKQYTALLSLSLLMLPYSSHSMQRCCPCFYRMAQKLHTALTTTQRHVIVSDELLDTNQSMRNTPKNAVIVVGEYDADAQAYTIPLYLETTDTPLDNSAIDMTQGDLDQLSNGCLIYLDIGETRRARAQLQRHTDGTYRLVVLQSLISLIKN